ncbi:MAG: restriction endonuclease subunit S [Paraclostridium sp.]
MNKIIDELGSDGVVYKCISDIASVSIGEFVHKNKQREDSQYPVYNGGISHTGYYEQFNRTSNKIIISARGANAGFVNRIFTDFWSGNSCYTVDVIDELVDWNYVYYWLKNKESRLLGDQQKAGIPAVSKKQVEMFPIVIPSIEIQRKIVSILDKFTETIEKLIVEVTDEIKAREKQYNYYRDELFAFKNTDVEWKTLDEIAIEMYRGAGIKRDQVTEDGIPCVRYGEIYTAYDISFGNCISHTDESTISPKKYFEYGDILFAITGESVEDISKSIAYLGHERCMAGGDIVVMKHTQNPRYLSYALSTSDAQKQKSKGKVKSKVVHSSVPSLKEIKVPVPSLEEQERIAKTLDSLRSIRDDISVEITEEIELRKKQYEYYRDKLLTFKGIKNE